MRVPDEYFLWRLISPPAHSLMDQKSPYHAHQPQLTLPVEAVAIYVELSIGRIIWKLQ